MSMFTNFGRKMIAARQKQVDRYVNTVLLTADDATLEAAGIKRENLRKNSAYTI